MTTIDRLKAQAKARRDAAIRSAERDYAHALKEIRAVERRLRRDSPRPKPEKRLKTGSAVELAERILAERGPLTRLELAVAVQAAGFVSKGGPQGVVGALRSGMRYHPGRFWCEVAVWGTNRG